MPTIGWPRWAVRASCWTQSGSFSAGARRSIEERRDDHEGGDLGRQRGAPEPADGDADPDHRRRVEAEASVPSHRRADLAARRRRRRAPMPAAKRRS